NSGNKGYFADNTTNVHSSMRNPHSSQKRYNYGHTTGSTHITLLPNANDKSIAANEPTNNINSERRKRNFVKEETIRKSVEESEQKKIEISSLPIRVSNLQVTDTLADKKFTLNYPQKSKEDKTGKTHKGIPLAYNIDYAFYFPVGRQQYSDLGPRTNTFLTNFAVFPMFRVYLNKKVSVELEPDLGAPQYTASLLVLNNKVNTINGSQAVTSQDSAIIRKLYYVNVPISIHYTVLKNFHVGTGLQFSKLYNGIGMFATKIDSSTNGYHTYIYTSIQNGNLKNTPVYEEIKHSEWRFLVDANYEWKKVIFGIRYNQSFSNFINTPVQAKNSAALFYVRFSDWKNKSAKKLLSE
ncbi:MAG TPA: hypothetical protein VKR53_05105, partial [Puia sp.]|nr:hypothetical protein [Puia sp.]